MGDVVLGYCHDGFLRAEFVDSLLGFGRVPRIAIESGPRISHARNEICRRFLAREEKWLLMVDTDMVIPRDVPEKLLSVGRPLVGALCYGVNPSGETFPVLTRVGDTGPERITEWDSRIVEVDGTGAACLLIHRDVLEKMGANFPPPHSWFEEITFRGKEIGEDTTFCLRAKELGFDPCVDTSAKVGHVKHHVIWE